MIDYPEWVGKVAYDDRSYEMADANKGRGVQLVRTDDSKPGVVRFYDRRQTEASKAFVAEVDVTKMPREALLKFAVHGVTQNLLDSSNKLEGDERLAYIKKQAAIVEAGGWATAPVDEAKIREQAFSALMKLGLTKVAAETMLAAAKPAKK